MSRLYAMLNDLERDAELTYANRTSGDLRGRRVRSAIRSKRRTRTVGIVAASTIAALGVTGTAWAVMTRDNVAPAIPTLTPSPTVSAPSAPSPTATPSPEVELTMPEFAGTVTVNEHLPSALPITPEVWNEAGPGWVLASYQESWVTWDEASWSEIPGVGLQAIYLIDPTGNRYELTTADPSVQLSIVSWSPLDAEALAIASTGDEASDQEWVMVDLAKGARRPVTAEDVAESDWTQDVFSPVSNGDQADRRAIQGADALMNLPAPTNAGPALTTEATEAALATARALAPSDMMCTDTVALETQVAVICGREPYVDYGGGLWYPYVVVFVADAGMGQGTVIDLRYGDPDDPLTIQVSATSERYGDSLVEASGAGNPYSCWDGMALVSETGTQALPGPQALHDAHESSNVFIPAGQAGDRLYTTVTGGCSGDAEPAALVVDNTRSGESHVLVPWPASIDTEPGLDGGVYVSKSLLSSYVVPEPH